MSPWQAVTHSRKASNQCAAGSRTSAAPPSAHSVAAALIWPTFMTVPVRSLIMAAKGEVIASIDDAVQFLAQSRWLRYNNLAFSMRPNRMEGTKTPVLVRKKGRNCSLISYVTYCAFTSCCFLLGVKVSSAEESQCVLHFFFVYKKRMKGERWTKRWQNDGMDGKINRQVKPQTDAAALLCCLAVKFECASRSMPFTARRWLSACTLREQSTELGWAHLRWLFKLARWLMLASEHTRPAARAVAL